MSADCLDDVVAGGDRRAVAPTAAQVNRSLLDIIQDEEPGALFGHKEKKSWKAFRDRLRLMRAGAAWTSSIPIPASDVHIQSNNPYPSYSSNARSFISRRNSVRFTTVSSLSPPADLHHVENSNDSSVVSRPRPQMTRRSSLRFGSTAPILSESTDSDEEQAQGSSKRHMGDQERSLSAREAVVAQEAAEAEAAAQAGTKEEEEETAERPEPVVRMSLMDLLEETDREMGLEGSTYKMGNDDDDEEDEEEEEDEVGGVEHTCCVCMVRHKGAAFIPCGHTFCRLCSRELWAQRGNCPLCNGYILEILDIF